jgi:hypothetical protein
VSTKLVLKFLATILIVVGWIVILVWRFTAEQMWVLLLAVAAGTAILIWLWWPAGSGRDGANAAAK